MLTESRVAQYRELAYYVCPQFLKQEIDIFVADIEEICSGATIARHSQTALVRLHSVRGGPCLSLSCNLYLRGKSLPK